MPLCNMTDEIARNIALDQINKSHNASVPYPSMHHAFITEIHTFLLWLVYCGKWERCTWQMGKKLRVNRRRFCKPRLQEEACFLYRFVGKKFIVTREDMVIWLFWLWFGSGNATSGNILLWVWTHLSLVMYICTDIWTNEDILSVKVLWIDIGELQHLVICKKIH